MRFLVLVLFLSLSVFCEVNISWNETLDPSAIGYKLYYAIEGETLDKTSPSIEIPIGTTNYDICLLPITATGENYQFSLTTANGCFESELSGAKVLPLSNAVPSAPSWN